MFTVELAELRLVPDWVVLVEELFYFVPNLDEARALAAEAVAWGHKAYVEYVPDLRRRDPEKTERARTNLALLVTGLSVN